VTVVQWIHGEAGFVRHAFKNEHAGLPSLCGRGRYPQDATPPARTPPACKWCSAVVRPPDGQTTGGTYARGMHWAQGKMVRKGNRNPRGYDG